MSTEMQVRDFHCNNCGTPLTIPKNSRGHVTCPSCKTECVIEGLVKNAEIQEKDNINSGIPLSAGTGTLHQKIVDVLTATYDMPLDVLTNTEVIKEEHICVPAYLFYCNAMCSYNYEAGNEREHKNQVVVGDTIRTEREQYVEWTQMGNNTSLSTTSIAPGCRDYSNIVDHLYKNLDPNRLVDIEELEFPFDVNTYSYNIPKNAAFAQYVEPYVKEEIALSVKSALSKRMYRNLSIGSPNIHKDEIIRVFLGIYHIVYRYNNQEYSLYITADGKSSYYESRPLDAQRTAFFTEKSEQLKALKRFETGATKWGIILLIAGIILGLLFTKWFWVLAAGGIGLIVLGVKKSNENKAAIQEVERQIAEFKQQADDAKRQFTSANKPLLGIYSPY